MLEYMNGEHTSEDKCYKTTNFVLLFLSSERLTIERCRLKQFYDCDVFIIGTANTNMP